MRYPTRRFLCALVAAFLFATLSSDFVARAAPRTRPNVIVIVADDLGYADVGAQGISKDVRTPNIDALMASGTRFTSGYVSCPVCSPTRAGLLTGRYQQRFGHEFNPGGAAPASFGLRLDQATLAQALKDAGYNTGAIGKWHEGNRPPYHPLSRGFDEYFGFLGGAHVYWNGRGGPGGRGAGGQNAILRGRDPSPENEYLTDAFAREAITFIQRHHSDARPFFLYLAFNAVHAPMQPPPQKYLDRFKDAPGSDKRHTYLAMLSALDDAVGAVTKSLRDAQLEGSTLIFFVSDNGGPTRQTTSSNTPLRGFKGDVWEGGIRVPFAISWPGHVQSGKTCDQPVIALDIFPTACAAAAGAMVPADRPMDGVNLLPLLTGEKTEPPHAALYWRFGEQAAVRQGDWKLVRPGVGETAQLFNLASDISESRNLATQQPEKLKQLIAALDAWNAQLEPPAWGGKGNHRQATGADHTED
jgi:arylsulfatase A-like enzyme